MMRTKMTMLGLLLAGTVALGCGAGSGGDNATGSEDKGSGDTTSTVEATGGNKPAAKTAKVGEATRDGKFEFTVKQTKCGVATVGPKLLEEKAQGQFCLVTVQVKNIGKEAQMLSDSNQKAYAADGTEYSTDTGAGIYANEDSATFLNEINPGNQVTGVLVFDIPKNVKLTKLELHDSAFSGGVTVALS
jgi:hypothetical protein